MLSKTCIIRESERKMGKVVGPILKFFYIALFMPLFSTAAVPLKKKKMI